MVHGLGGTECGRFATFAWMTQALVRGDGDAVWIAYRVAGAQGLALQMPEWLYIHVVPTELSGTGS